MAYRASYCANEACRWHREKKGGEFFYSKDRGGMMCPDCFYAGSAVLPTMAKSAFDFVTSSITGKPIHVHGMNHLAQLEKQHGCSSVVLNQDRSNWGSPKRPRENWQTPPTEKMSHGVTVGVRR
jgi:hypothetical protein